MNNTILLIISLVIVGIIFLFGFVSAKNMKRKYSQLPNETQEQSEASVEKPAQMRQTDIYEKSGKNQESDHPLGAIQSVIRGRIRFIPTGLSFIAIALFGLYIFYFTDKKFLIDRTPINTVIVTILFIGAILCGLQFVNYAFYRIKLRHTGFEISSMLGTKSYEYKDVDFYLNKTIEHKHNSDGHRPVFGKVGNFNYIWICQIIFKDTRKPIILKSSRYARLRDKISELIEALNGKNV